MLELNIDYVDYASSLSERKSIFETIYNRTQSSMKQTNSQSSSKLSHPDNFAILIYCILLWLVLKQNLNFPLEVKILFLLLIKIPDWNCIICRIGPRKSSIYSWLLSSLKYIKNSIWKNFMTKRWQFHYNFFSDDVNREDKLYRMRETLNHPTDFHPFNFSLSWIVCFNFLSSGETLRFFIQFSEIKLGSFEDVPKAQVGRNLLS